MIRWVRDMPARSASKLRREFRARIDAERVRLERDTLAATPAVGALSIPAAAGGGAPGRRDHETLADPDRAEFDRTYAAASRAAATSTVEGLRTEVAFALFKLSKANQRGDSTLIRQAGENLKIVSGVLHDEELRADRLGRETGATIPITEVQRIARAVPYWLLRGIDDLLARLCRPLADRSGTGPLFPEEIRQLLEPHLLETRLFLPLERALKSPTALALPPSWSEAWQAGVAATIEDAGRHFAQLYPAPPPPPFPSFIEGDGI